MILKMKSEKKIFLEKTEDLNTAVDKMIKAQAGVVVLNLPRDSVIGSSVNNFHVLKEKALPPGKN